MTASASLRTQAALCLVIAPTLLLIADVLQVTRPHSIAFTVLLAVSFLFFVPCIFALAYVLRPTSPKLSAVAAALAVAGSMAGAAMQVLFRVHITLENAGLDATTLANAKGALKASPLLAATTLMPGALFPLGFLLLSVALLRSREFPTAAVVLLGVGAILFPIGHAVGVTPALIGGDVVLVVAMSWIASHLRARPALWW